MRSVALFFVAIVLCLSSTLSFGQDSFFADWFNMVSQTQAEQPHWITPLATTTPRLEQEFRYDLQWQTHNSGLVTDNYGVSKGLEIIPAKNVEVIVAVPPYVVNNPDSPDGFGDWQFLVKYRMAAGNEQHGNYILSAFFQMSLPTGQYEQGATNPVITPTFAYGKGFKDFDVQGTFGISLPTGNTMAIGRNLTWNNTFQYRIFKKIWPETELNFTHYYQGPHSGHTLLYATPGLVLGRFNLWHRLAFTFGGGYEIATTSFHPTNHIPILSIRFPF
ncbi:MAG TPA: hypothetical protein VJX69_01400 [Terriglobales bacterium]|nr:hypothetical protein [Terriglobales bacterium]